MSILSLLVVPLYGLPLYLIAWLVMQLKGKRDRGAWKPFLWGMLAWLGSTAVFIVVGLVIFPCLEGCARYETPMRIVAVFFAALAYAGVAALIAYRVHHSAKTRVRTPDGPS